MSTLKRLGSLGVLTAFLSFPDPASAGGWWSSIRLEGQYVAAGEEVKAGTEFLFRSIEEAEDARQSGRFYAYLIAGFDFTIVEEAMSKPEPRGWWTLGGARAIRVGTVRLTGWDANLARAHTRFVVPDVEPGIYALMFCDAGCAYPLGDIVPTRVSVVEDPLTAQLARRLERLEARRGRETVALRAATRAAREAKDLSEDLESLETRTARVEARLAGRENPSRVPWAAFAGWFLAGASLSLLVAIVLRRRMGTRAPVRSEEPDLWLDEPKELVTSDRP